MLSVGCPKPLEQCQGCRIVAFLNFNWCRRRDVGSKRDGWPARSGHSAAPLRIGSGIKCGACNCTLRRNAPALPSRLSQARCRFRRELVEPVNSEREAAGAKSSAGEREAAGELSSLSPMLSVGCPKPLEQCQGCSASDERRVAFDCGLSEQNLMQAPQLYRQQASWAIVGQSSRGTQLSLACVC